MPSLYIVCAARPDDPSPDWVAEAVAVVRSDHPEFAAWQVEPLIKADDHNTFNPLDVYAGIAKSLGPVLYVGGLKASAITMLNSKLANKCVVAHCTPASSTDVYDAILALMAQHDSGDPQVPRRFAVALMLVAKLERMHYWGGNAKNFMSVHKLAKSNGLDKQYQATAHEVADYMASSARTVNLLLMKTGDGYPKYACNGTSREIVYRFLRDRAVNDPQMMTWLLGDVVTVSARELDAIVPENYEPPR